MVLIWRKVKGNDRIFEYFCRTMGNDSKENKEIVLGLSKILFWDVDPYSVDAEKHAAFIVYRVLQMGRMDDFKAIKEYYGKARILDIAKNLRYMDDRVLHFCSVYFNVPLEQFRCYTLKQLNLSHWNY